MASPASPSAPAWANELRLAYESGASSQFILFGNVHDRLAVGDRLVSLADFLEDTLLKPFDVVVQRGTNHAWVNRGTKPCRVAFILVDAKE